MKKVIVFLFIFIALISFYITATNSESNKVSEKVLEQIQKQGNARVMINLKELSETKGFIFKTKKTSFEINSEKQKIKNIVIRDIKKENLRHTFNKSISAIISKKNLVNLENNIDVKSVELVGTRHIFLQDSIPLINANKTWNLQINNVNLTGLGETVCIIDTGVNYTLPDLGGCYGNNNVSSSCKVIGGWDYCADDKTCTTEDSDPMDAQGHGTHVSGIVSANGSIKGVAPDAKIVMIKASNSTGTFWEDDLIKAVDWCVNNASTFNISVISMSLGGRLYSSYCNADVVAPSINNAILNNISVVIATGNNGNSTDISSPACIENATAVGATNKDDTIASYSNRNNMTDLLAPGTNINSTVSTGSCTFCKPSGYNVLSGTSMATPHVAGAFALIRQFFRLQSNKVLTPKEIENSLKNTGKQINDSGYSNLNYSRIDIYSAILSLDNKAPNVTLVSPSDNLTNTNVNQTFSCNATDNLQLNNLTFYLWNSTNNLINKTTLNISGVSNQSSFNFTNMSYDSYKWNCLSYDGNGNSAFASGNFSLTIKNKFVTLSSPNNNSYTNINNTNFTCNSGTSSTLQLTNSTFYLWNSTDNLIYDKTKNISGNLNETTFNFTFVNESSYLWNCFSYDNSSELIFANLNSTLTYDMTNPNITLISPLNKSSSLTGTNNVDFKYNISEKNLANCSLIINNVEVQTNSSVNTSITNKFTESLSAGTYNWKINCLDFAGNTENSSTRALTINLQPLIQVSNSGGGGGGAGIIYSTYSIDKNQIEQGVSKRLKINDKLKFNVKNEEHIMKINKISSDKLTLTISSNPITLTLKINETRKINLDNNKYYDLEVFLNSIKNSRANISIKSINEKIPVMNIFDLNNKTNESKNSTQNNQSNSILKKDNFKLNKQEIKITISAVFAILIVYFLTRFKKHFINSKKKVKKKKRHKSKTK